MSRVILGDRTRSHVGLVTQPEDPDSPSRARQASSHVCSRDSRESDVVVHQEFSGRDGVVGPGTNELAVVVPVPCPPTRVDEGPVGHVLEEKVGRILQRIRRLQRRHSHESFRIACSREIAHLHGIAATERHFPAAMKHPAADVEILIDNDDGGPEVAGTDGGRKTGTTGSDDDDVGFVVPNELFVARC